MGPICYTIYNMEHIEVLVSDFSSALDAVEADSTAEVAGPAARLVSQVWAEFTMTEKG